MELHPDPDFFPGGSGDDFTALCFFFVAICVAYGLFTLLVLR